ncbi:MAG: insulinase family protein [Bacilli bacterium]|nr:insulinase family protein [Bacilli bacterium]
MKEIKLAGLDTSIFYEKLKNGLEVFLCPIKNKSSYTTMYVTKYGSDRIEFVPNGKKKKVRVPNGIAHFLEHKLFETEEGIDPFTFYAEQGSDANAFTNYDVTAYYFTGTTNYEENLAFLLKYVNTPYFTDENVAKEKGIIKEEINMGLDNPDRVLAETLRKNTYKNLPRKNNVIGSVKDIEKITKEDLYRCYSAFYQPSNMFIIATGNIDVKKAMEIIHHNFDGITSYPVPKKVDYKEDLTVAKAKDEIKMNVQIPKVGMAFKTKTEDYPIKNEVELDYYLYMIIAVVLGRSSDYYEEIVENNIALSFGTFSETVDGFKTLYVYATTKEPDKFIKTFEKYTKNIEISTDDFNRYKKIWIANLVRSYENVDNAADSIFMDIVRYNKIVDNKLKIIKGLNKKDLDRVIKELNLSNKVVLKMVNKDY